MSTTKEKMTPPQVARLWGISPDKVVAWIKSGELRAIDASTRPGGRPRYLIDVADIRDFESRRAAAVGIAAEFPRNDDGGSAA